MSDRLGLSVRRIGALAAALCLSAAAWGQDAREEEQSDRQPVPNAGFWPTDRMMEGILHRISDDLAETYGFDDEQLEQTREVMKNRFPKFLNENRGEIMTLVNQFFEAQVSDGAPEPGHVADWAQRALPLLNKFTEEVRGATEEMRGFMTEDQQVLLEGELAAFETGVTLASNKLGVWADGGYDPETEWIPNRRERRRREHEQRLANEAAMEQARDARLNDLGYAPQGAPGAAQAADVQPMGNAAPEGGVAAGGGGAAGGRANGRARPDGKGAARAAPADAWEQYVQDYARRYEFTEDQRQDATRFLRSRQEERDSYLRRKAEELDRVSRLVKEADSEDARKKADSEFQRLNKPVDRMFQQLKDKLDSLPTRAQRERAATRQTREDAAKTKTEPKPKGD